MKNFTQPIQQRHRQTSFSRWRPHLSVFEFLEEEEEDITVENPVKPDHIEGSVEFSYVHFGYNPGPDHHHDFSGKGKADSRLLPGPTGAGKHVPWSSFCEILRCSSGAILLQTDMISGITTEPICEMHSAWYCRTHGSLRAIHYGKYPLRSRLDASQMRRSSRQQGSTCVPLYPDITGGSDKLPTRMHPRVKQGQKQLLTIARAILADNPILILDEATSCRYTYRNPYP